MGQESGELVGAGSSARSRPAGDAGIGWGTAVDSRPGLVLPPSLGRDSTVLGRSSNVLGRSSNVRGRSSNVLGRSSNVLALKAHLQGFTHLSTGLV